MQVLVFLYIIEYVCVQYISGEEIYSVAWKFIKNSAILSSNKRWWRVIIAVNFQFKQLERRSLKNIRASTDFKFDTTSASTTRHRNAAFMYNSQFISWNFRNLLVDNLVNIFKYHLFIVMVLYLTKLWFILCL